jgi:hypothetical protein
MQYIDFWDNHIFTILYLWAPMAEWLCCLTRTNRVLCSNLGATRHRMILDNSLMAACLESLGRWILITFHIQRPSSLVCGESVCTGSSCTWTEEFCLRPAFEWSRHFTKRFLYITQFSVSIKAKYKSRFKISLVWVNQSFEKFVAFNREISSFNSLRLFL